MARKKSPENSWMPEHVYKSKYCYVYKPPSGESKSFASINDSKEEVWIKYHEIVNLCKNTCERVIHLFCESEQYKEKSAATRKDYQQSMKALIGPFKSTPPEKITPPMFRKYMDIRGKTSKVRANREKAFMQVVFQWALERGYVQTNPIKEVKSFREVPRDRYITDQEYLAVYEIAPPAVKIAMDISYICAMRLKDVLELTYDKCTDDGIFLKQSKTGKKHIKAWTDDLRGVIAESKKGKICSKFVVRNRRGRAYTDSGFKCIWQKLIVKAFAAGLVKERFTFHDIKAKAISDYEGDKKRFSGHKTMSQVEVYDRKLEVVVPLNKLQKK